MRDRYFTARPRESGYPAWIPACAGMSGVNSIFERCAANEILLAVEQHDFDRNIAAGDNVLGGMLRRVSHGVAERDAAVLRKRESFGGGVGAENALAKLRVAARGRGNVRQFAKVDLA